jgi:hypothetical protein
LRQIADLFQKHAQADKQDDWQNLQQQRQWISHQKSPLKVKKAHRAPGILSHGPKNHISSISFIVQMLVTGAAYSADFSNKPKITWHLSLQLLEYR